MVGVSLATCHSHLFPSFEVLISRPILSLGTPATSPEPCPCNSGLLPVCAESQEETREGRVGSLPCVPRSDLMLLFTSACL